jgi:hypothetical protein
MLTVFWGKKGPVLKYYQERGKTINNAGYSDMLIDRIKPAIQSKC